MTDEELLLIGIAFEFLHESQRRIEHKLDHLIRQERAILMDLSAITAAVAANTTVEESAVALLTQLSDLVRSTAGDPAAANALADQLNADSGNLAAAVTANTPAAPAAPGGTTAPGATTTP